MSKGEPHEHMSTSSAQMGLYLSLEDIYKKLSDSGLTLHLLAKRRFISDMNSS
jgi:hypothetical protein